MRAPVLAVLSLIVAPTLLAGCKGCKAGPRYPRQGERVEVDCAAREGRPPRQDCVSREIRCGETVKGTTSGGTSVYADDFYRGKYCVTSASAWTGPERVYTLQVPEQTAANLFLDGDCADLDLFAFRWNFEGTCPGTGHAVAECEADAASGGSGFVHVETTTNPAQYFVVIDGKDGVTAPFALTVECGPRG